MPTALIRRLLAVPAAAVLLATAAPGAAIDGAQLDRVFDIAGTGNVTMTGRTITGGLTPLDPVLILQARFLLRDRLSERRLSGNAR